MVNTSPLNDLLLRAARREKTERTPVWLMRQAGRYDPEYQRIKEMSKCHLEDMFRNPELAAEATLLPLRFGVDAAILFQDILTPLGPMGAPFVFRPVPALEKPILKPSDLKRLHAFTPEEELSFVPKSIDYVLYALDNSLPLLGFAGAPFTLAVFILENGSPGGELSHTRRFMQAEPSALHELLEMLTEMTTAYLRMQINSGVHAVQLFESAADLVSLEEYTTFVQPYQKVVMQSIGDTCPRILFVKEQPYLDLCVETGADVISVGTCTDIEVALQQYGDKVAIQGNVDNDILLNGTTTEIEETVIQCIDKGAGKGHILNLNHGILKGTPLENVQRFIDTAKKHQPEKIVFN